MTAEPLPGDRASGEAAGKSARGAPDDGTGNATGETPLTIAVLDSGISPAHPQVGPVAGGVRIALVEGEVRYADDWRDGLGHGTAVAATISEDLPPDGWRLLSVRVFGRRLEAPPAGLAAGIRWAAKHGAHLVNLSAGVPAGTDPAGEALLAAAVAEAGRLGVTVVAPRRSGDTLLVPGALPDALPHALPRLVPVEADPAIARREFVRRGAALVTSPWARPLPPLPKEKNFSGVSFAVATATNGAARVVHSNRNSRGLSLPRVVPRAVPQEVEAAFASLSIRAGHDPATIRPDDLPG